MGWLLGCFKCTGKPEGLKSKKHLSAVNDLASGRSNSAAVAHATSPEDLHIVRKLPASLEATNSRGHVEKEPYDSLSSPLQDKAKIKKSAKSISKQDEDKGWSHEYDLDGDLESFRERLLQDSNAAKQLSDEVKFLRGCPSLLESPSNAFKVTFDKSDQDPSEQVDYAQHSWLVSSLITRIQPGGLLIEGCSRPSRPLLNVCEGDSLCSRGIHASQSNSFDGFGDNNGLKCAELSLFRVESSLCNACVDGIRESLQTTQNKTHCETNPHFPERNVPSPPWTFSSEKANEKISSIEPSDDLLLEHLDISSLIQDSALITNWELSSGSSFMDTSRLTDQFLQIPCEEETKMQANQKHSESRTDEGSLDFDLNCLPAVLKAHTKKEPGFCIHPFADEATCSSNGIRSEANGPYGGIETIHAEEVSIGKDADHLLRAEFWAAAEESDSDSTSQSCFSSQFRLSKCAWDSTRKNLPDKESNIWDYLQQSGSKDAQEVLLPGIHPKKESLQESNGWEDEHHPLLRATSETSIAPNNNGVSHGDYTDVYVNGNVSYLSLGPLEAKVTQDSAQDFPLKDDGIKSLLSFPLEEEDREQRKKIKIGDGGESGRLRESMLVEEDEVPLLDAAAIEDGHESSVEVRAESFSEYESTGSKHVDDESSFEQPLPSSPLIGTPPSVTSYRSPASLADERPILGTVAAHWSPITTRKWWDGKGIPNSTNKYQEDQKVSWHAIPFEVRLEQALAKQDTVLSK